MAYDCSGTWDSCLNSTGSSCLQSDPGYEGKMVIRTPDPLTGAFTGRFYPRGGGPSEVIYGQCSDQKPHMQIWRGLHYYHGDKSGNKNVKGKRRKVKVVAKGRRIKPLRDDEDWVGTKTT